MEAHKVIISLGSNHQQKQNLHQARQRLAQILSHCNYTEEIWTEPIPSSPPAAGPITSSPPAATVGTRRVASGPVPVHPDPLPARPEPVPARPDPVPAGAPLYLNQLVAALTTLPFDLLQAALKDIEARLGRTPDLRRQGIVPIDLDILLYGDQRHHLRDWSRPYVTNLLPQVIIPDEQEV